MTAAVSGIIAVIIAAGPATGRYTRECWSIGGNTISLPERLVVIEDARAGSRRYVESVREAVQILLGK
jgi:hypothetical protein